MRNTALQTSRAGNMSRVQSGNVDDECRTFARLAFGMDFSTVLFYYAIDGCQPQTGTLAQILGSEKRFEYPVLYRGIHAATGIADADANIYPRRNSGMTLAVETVQGRSSGRERDHAGAVYGVPCVDDQVEQNLVGLCRINQNRACIALGNKIELNFLADQFTPENDLVGNRLIDVQNLRFHDLFAGKGQQLFSEVCRTDSGMQYLLKIGVGFVITLNPS